MFEQRVCIELLMLELCCNTVRTTCVHRSFHAGFTQGLVSGHLLLLLYINDIADDLESLTRSFADDTSLSYSSTSTIDIETI